MARRVLGISWLHGFFQAVATSGDTVQATWIAPNTIQTPADFASALQQAVAETKFKGSQVAVVIDHRNLLFHVQETPPSKGKTLERILERQVSQSQFFDEAPVWKHVELPASKSGHRCLLALLPGSLVRGIDDACGAANLQLTSLFPPASVMARHLKRLDAPPGETVILATDLGGSLNIVLGRTTGQIFLSRTVVLSGKIQSDRAAQELNRTLHYAQQQFGANVSRLFISGEEAFAMLKSVSIRDGLEILNASGGEGPLDLPRLAALLPTKTTFNFITRRASRELALRATGATGLAAAFVASLLTVLHVENSVRAREYRATAMIQAHASESQIQSTATAREREARQLSAIIQAVGSTNEAPVAQLFVRALPSLLPDSIRVTEVSVSQAASSWEFQIKGVVTDTEHDFSDTLERLEKDLQSSAFKASITDSTQQQLFRGDSADVQLAPRRTILDSGRSFFVKGTLP